MKKSPALDKTTVSYLRTLAHNLKPIVRLGQQGLTDAVTRELDGALAHHELVKIKLSASEKESRLAQLDTICTLVHAECVQQIGHTATLFRRNSEKPVIELTPGKP